MLKTIIDASSCLPANTPPYNTFPSTISNSLSNSLLSHPIILPLLSVILPPSTPSASQKGSNKLAAFLAATATKDVALQQALQQGQGQGLGSETDFLGPRSTKETVNTVDPYLSSTKSTANIADKGPGPGLGLGEVSNKGGLSDKGLFDQSQPAVTAAATSTATSGPPARKPSAVLSAITALQTKGVQVEVRHSQHTLSIHSINTPSNPLSNPLS